MKKNDNMEAAGAVTGCGCVTAIVAANITLGAWCFDYSLAAVFGKDIPWYADAACGLLLGQFSIPIAVVCWVMKLCGVVAPFIQ